MPTSMKLLMQPWRPSNSTRLSEGLEFQVIPLETGRDQVAIMSAATLVARVKCSSLIAAPFDKPRSAHHAEN